MFITFKTCHNENLEQMSIENYNNDSEIINESSIPATLSSTYSRNISSVSLTSTPKHRTPRVHFEIDKVSDSIMFASNSRQEFLSESNGNIISYDRNGGCFVNKWSIIGIIIVVIGIVVAVGFSVHYYVPCHNLTTIIIEDDFSWNTEYYRSQSASENLRLPDHIKPNYYRLIIKPNLTSNTFEGRVVITLASSKLNVNLISLHSKNLEILNKTSLTGQNVYTSSDIQSNFRRKKRQSEELNVKIKEPMNITSLKDSNDTNLEINVTDIKEINIKNDTIMINDTETKTTTEKSSNIEAPILTQARIEIMDISEQKLDPKTERLTFKLQSTLKPQMNYTLEIHFKGKINEALHGFYSAKFKDSTSNINRTIAVTYFEPVQARTAFPCFDEPNFKAMFEISIAKPKNMSIMSNMPLHLEEEVENEPNMTWAHFERSPPMSPYLVAFSIFSNIESQDGIITDDYNETNSNASMKIWARKELLDQTKYASEIAPKLLSFYERYFGIPYSLPKLDLIAIPNFVTNAMENWGIITFREPNLLIDLQNAPIKAKKNIAMIIAHHLAHQWFGNLVTMRWWNDLWLNEGFATYMQYIGVDEIEPQWELLDLFELNKMTVLQTDGIKSTRPVSAMVNDQNLFTQIFDDISFIKAASLLRMLNHVLSTDLFQSGFNNYMNKWQFKNADQNDLWEAFTTAISDVPVMPENITVAKFMNSWTLEPGYPVIYVDRNYEKGTATITQRRFCINNSSGNFSKQLWYIPITYASGNSSYDSWLTSPRAWLEKTNVTSVIFDEIKNSTWVYFNVMSIGHYRVNYDQKNWILLEHGLYDNPKEFPVITRAQLLDDAFNLARAGDLTYKVPLDLTRYMKDGERTYLPWYTALNNLKFLHYRMQKTSYFSLFQEYIERLIMPTLEEIGYSATPSNSMQTILLRDYLIKWACLVEESGCINWVRDKFNNWTNQTNPDKNNPIPVDNRETIYSNALWMGSKSDFNFLFERFEKSTNPEIKVELISSLVDARNVWQLYFLLEYSVTKMDIQMIPYVWGRFESDVVKEVAFDYVCKNWNQIYNKFSEIDEILTFIIDGAFGNINTDLQLRQYKSFIKANKEKLLLVSNVVKKNLEEAELRIKWYKQNIEDIGKWLENFAMSKPGTVNEYSTL